MARRIARKRIRRAPRKAPPSFLDYQRTLITLVRDFGREMTQAVLEQWPKWSAELGPKPAQARADVRAPREIRLVIDGVQAEVRIEDRAKQAATEQATRVNKRNRDTSNAATRALLGSDWFGEDDPLNKPPPVFRTPNNPDVNPIRAVQPYGPDIKDLKDLFVESNTGLISAITQTQAEQIGQIVSDNLVAGVTAADTAREIAERTGVAESRAKFLARDQTAKLNAQLSQTRMGQAGIDQYEWSTSKDERVRDSHAEKDGQIFFFSDPPADTGNPGEDYNCRCVSLAVLPEDE